ncbi:hypothetical protein LTR86_008992 [Recurvomyces mirabilis]|nr:hypothetical protein LTR86_008992 [Recurvomyces mirabilis]
MAPEKSNYKALANILSTYPDILAIKRFRELQIRNLLFYQAELAHLELELTDIEQRDAQAATVASGLANSRWTPLMAQVPTTTSPKTMSSLYCEKMLQIRKTLQNYNNAVEQYKRLNEIGNPKRSDMRAVCDWLSSMNGGASFLTGDVEDVWTTRDAARDIIPRSPEDFYAFEEDHGIAIRIGRFIAWLQRLFSFGRTERQPHHIDTSGSGGLGQILSTIIASVLPVIPIVVFYFVKQLLLRIGLILVFTAAFAALLVVGLQLSPDTSLGITTAQVIAAIQVVYVGATANTTNN